MNEHYLFVYGTLMRGYGNHRYLEGAEFIGPAISAESKFRLFDSGFPALANHGRNRVRGEVYLVSDEILARCDRLEGIPHHYTREREMFRVNGHLLVTYVYVISARALGEGYLTRQYKASGSRVQKWPGYPPWSGSPRS